MLFTKGVPRAKKLIDKERICRKCKQNKPIEEFVSRIRYDVLNEPYRQYEHACRRCSSGSIVRRAKARYEALGLCWCGRPRADKLSKCEKCLADGRACKAKKKQEIKHKQKLYRIGIKREAFTAYGNCCACCKIDFFEFLEIDHIGGWGKDHINPNGQKIQGSELYRYLKANGFPKDRFRLLCGSCHGAISYHGYCPHGNLPDAMPPKDIPLAPLPDTKEEWRKKNS